MKNKFFKEIIVWMIIGIGLIIFSGFAVIIGLNQGSFPGSYKYYKTVFEEASGMNIGSKVNIHGARTGNVSSMKVLPDGHIEVTFNVRKDHLFLVNNSTRVEIKNAGALGDRYLNIVTENLSAKKLNPGSTLPYQKSSNLLSFFTEGREGSKNSIQDIFQGLDDLLEKLNEEGLVDLLSESDKKELSEVLKNTNKTLKLAHSILEKIESGEGTLGALLNDPSLYNRIQVLLGARPKKNYLKDLSQQKK